MKRNPRKVRWTKAFRKAAGKEMTIVCPADYSKLLLQLKTSLLVTVGLDHRFRKTQERPSALQPRAGPDHDQSYETHRGDQEEEGTCVLEE